MVDMENKLLFTYFQQFHAWDLGMQNELKEALYDDLTDYITR